jgi:hypothetical protein
MSISITTSISTQGGPGRSGYWTRGVHWLATQVRQKSHRSVWEPLEELAHLDKHFLTAFKFDKQSSAFAAFSFEVHERLRGDALTNVKPNEARMRELAQAPLDIHGAHADFVASARGAAYNGTSDNP